MHRTHLGRTELPGGSLRDAQELAAGLSQALYRATGELYRRHVRGPHQ
jgi:hypothetical protein